MKVASMCLLHSAMWTPSLLQFLLAKRGDPNCRARGLGQDSHDNEGPRLLLTACSEDVPLQSVKYLLSSHDDKVKLSIATHPKAKRVVLCQCIKDFLDLQEAIVTSKRTSEARNELIAWVLKLVQEYICALAVPISKKKNSEVVPIENVREGDTVSFAGKILTKSGLMRQASTGILWAWADIQDSAGVGKLRVKAFYPQAAARFIADSTFLDTYIFHDFKVEQGFGAVLEAVAMRGARMESVYVKMNPGDTWDHKKYAPLTDITRGEDKTSHLNFILKIVQTGATVDEWRSVDVIDEEGTQKNIKVHECHEDYVQVDGFVVVHRAKMQDDVCVVDAWAMLAPAPNSYTW